MIAVDQLIKEQIEIIVSDFLKKERKGGNVTILENERHNQMVVDSTKAITLAVVNAYEVQRQNRQEKDVLLEIGRSRRSKYFLMVEQLGARPEKNNLECRTNKQAQPTLRRARMNDNNRKKSLVSVAVGIGIKYGVKTGMRYMPHLKIILPLLVVRLGLKNTVSFNTKYMITASTWADRLGLRKIRKYSFSFPGGIKMHRAVGITEYDNSDALTTMSFERR